MHLKNSKKIVRLQRLSVYSKLTLGIVFFYPVSLKFRLKLEL